MHDHPVGRPVRRAAGGADGADAEVHFEAALTAHVREHIGPIAKPKDVVAVADIPKTRSGKITRRLLGELYQGRSLGDVSSLQNEEALGHIAQVLVDTGRVSEAV